MFDYIKNHPWFSKYQDFVATSEKDTDYRFGENRGLIDLRGVSLAKYLPSNERQRRYNLETYACGPFTGCTGVEVPLNYAYRNNEMPYESRRFLEDNGYIVNGKVETSERFVAYNSDITKGVGTSFRKVGQAITNYGLVPESKWPYPKDGEWDTYYSRPPQKIFDLGTEFLKHFLPVYKVVYESEFDQASNEGVIQAAVWAWLFKNGIYYNPYGKQNHFTALYHDKGTHDLVFDSYSPFIKKLAPNYDYYYYGYLWGARIVKKNDNMRLVKVENSPHYYAIAPNGQRMRITSWGSLQQGETNGLWKIEDTEIITDEELKKHPDGGELGYLL